MTYPTFNSGDVLTAAEMNAVGLWLVKTQTIGTGVATVAVTGAFSTDYDHYRVIIQADSIAAGGPYLTIQMGATVTGYYYAAPVANYATGTVTAVTTNNGASWNRLGPGTTTSMAGVYDILNPFKTENTFITGTYADASTGGSAGVGSGFLNNTTSYTAFTIGVTSSTMTGGTIRVYGYRN